MKIASWYIVTYCDVFWHIVTLRFICIHLYSCCIHLASCLCQWSSVDQLGDHLCGLSKRRGKDAVNCGKDGRALTVTILQVQMSSLCHYVVIFLGSGIVLGIMFFVFRFVDSFLICCSVCFLSICSILELEAAISTVLQHFGVRTSHFPWYSICNIFGAQTFHVGWTFCNWGPFRICLGFVLVFVSDWFRVGFVFINGWFCFSKG